MSENFSPPNLKKMQLLFSGLQRYFDPTFINIERLDLHRPALFVGNHTIFGLLDIPLMLNEIYRQHGVYLRSLGDHAHYYFPGWHQALHAGGMLEGTPENCSKLMQQGESILVFPGGSREVMRRKNDDYQLFWKNRAGFAKMAIEHGYDIIPFACVGPNECFNIHYDAEEVLAKPWIKSTIQKLKLEKTLRSGDVFAPLATGLLGLPLPKPQKFYFSFGERLCGSDYDSNESHIFALRQQVEQSVLTQIEMLKDLRMQDKRNHWSWLRKKLTSS